MAQGDVGVSWNELVQGVFFCQNIYFVSQISTFLNISLVLHLTTNTLSIHRLSKRLELSQDPTG